jgi:hypothetical protein
MTVVHGEDCSLTGRVPCLLEVPGGSLIYPGKKPGGKPRQAYFIEVAPVILEAEQAQRAKFLERPVHGALWQLQMSCQFPNAPNGLLAELF